MGVVRREGNWRLEKRGEGVYEITHQQNAQLKVLTPDYNRGMFDDPLIDTIPVREVGSYAEVEGLFEEKAHTGMQGGFGFGGGDQIGSLDSSFDNDVGNDLPAVDGQLTDIDAPPGMIAIVLIFVGGVVLFNHGWQPTEIVFQVGSLMAVGGLIILAWGVLLGESEGWDAAMERLFKTGDGTSSSRDSVSNPDVETTPPASEKTKNTIIFDRANQLCEWCGKRSDHLEVHHIEPRSKGGPNDPSNLIALCPDDHRKADAGGISKTKLNAKVRRLPAVEFE